MSGYIVDASAAVEYLLRTSLGLTIAETIRGVPLAAPELIDTGVLSAPRLAVLHRGMEEARARLVVDSLPHWPVTRISLRALTPLAWQHYRNVSAYDAFYVAAAKTYGLPLLTADGRLARASGLGVTVQSVGMA